MKDKLKNKLISGLEQCLNKFSGQQSKFRKFYIQQKDQMLGRDRVGVDKFGNKYYQYYSYHGLPTKRIVLYKFFHTNCFHQDPHFIGWLRKNEVLPPTPEELERLYLEHDSFVQRGIAWDEEQQAIIEEFDRKKKELDQKYDREQLSLGDDNDPDSQIVKKWVPGTKANLVENLSKEMNDEFMKDVDVSVEESETALAVIDEIDKLEELYLEEYTKLYEKDQENNKDLNVLAIEELKRTQYFFAYLRTQEKLQAYERKKKEDDAKVQEYEEMSPEQKQEYHDRQVQAQNTDATIQKNKILDALTDKDLGAGKINNTLGTRKGYVSQRQSDLSKDTRYGKFREEFKDVFEQVYENKTQENKE